MNFLQFTFICTIYHVTLAFKNLSDCPLIPIPDHLENGSGKPFIIATQLTISSMFGEESEQLRLAQILEDFKNLVELKTGLQVPIVRDNGSVVFSYYKNQDNQNSCYTISITESKIIVIGQNGQCLFYAAQTLAQAILKFTPKNEYFFKTLLTDSKKVLNTTKNHQLWYAPSGIIIDTPRYKYRGMMLDVARHFFPVSTIFKLVDLLAFYKINYLHLHLSDDQGWRIQIESRPMLTEIGSISAVGGDLGGFYSQKQYKSIVAYAQSKYITIVPEIDIPGHTHALLASYPNIAPSWYEGPKCDILNMNLVPPNTPVKFPLYTGINVGFSSVDVHKKETFKLLDDVIREISRITPGRLFHIGGDEVKKGVSKPEYKRFISQVAAIVRKYGKTVVGWQEIADCDQEGTHFISQAWNEFDEGRTLQSAPKIILSPSTRTYLDMKYDSNHLIGLSWAGFIGLEKCYCWDPEELGKSLFNASKNQIIGIEAPLWTETIITEDHLFSMVLPRLPAIAEVAWSSQTNRDWISFKNRIAYHASIWIKKKMAWHKVDNVIWNN